MLNGPCLFQPEVDTGPGDNRDIAIMDDSVALAPAVAPGPTSMEDEDTSGDTGIVSETDVLAEVRLPTRIRKFSFINFRKASTNPT